MKSRQGWYGLGLAGLMWIGFAAEARAQDPLAPAAPPPGISHTTVSETGALQSLEALQRALRAKEAEVASLQDKLASATDDLTREDIRQRLLQARAAVDDQRRQFDQFSADIDLSPFSPQPETRFDWQEQVGKLLQPILAEFEAATAEARVIGNLRSQLEEVRKRRDLARQAVDNLDRLLAQPDASAELRGRLEENHRTWKRLLEQAENEYSAVDLQLQSRLAARESMLDQTTGYAKTFFRTRGLNLFLGLVAFGAVFFVFRLGELILRKLRRKGAEKNLGSRVTSLVFHIFSVLGGLVAMMLVFNVVADWFLLGIVIIFLFGVGWASIHTLPQQIETIKLMLNIGAVREGELLRYDGTAYRVEALGFAAVLKNPKLEGGARRLPVKYLVGMTSRPTGDHESWFPCDKGDWVALSDGHTGQVMSQTPGAVELILPGGEHLVYPTADFLGLHPRNLSDRFRITTTFGLDYRHQAIATREVPDHMRRALTEQLPDVIGPDHIREVQVWFSGAGASSLDYRLVVDLNGSAAPVAPIIPGAIHRILVDLCTERHWTIPFPQLTVHSSGGSHDGLG